MHIRMLVEECVCDANDLESGSQDECLIQGLTEKVEPYAQLAVQNCGRSGHGRMPRPCALGPRRRRA